MNRKYLGATLALALAFALGSLIRAEDAAKTEQGELKMVACPPECGFSCTSRNENELVEALKAHAKAYHNMNLTDEQAKSMIKPVDTPAKAKDERKG